MVLTPKYNNQQSGTLMAKKEKSVAELLEQVQDILAEIQDKVSENEVDDWSDEDEDAWSDTDLDDEDQE